MMEDYYNDGFNDGYGRDYLNYGHSRPQTDGDIYSYEQGREDGVRRRNISDEIDRELLGVK
jgi:hypothetical protein